MNGHSNPDLQESTPRRRGMFTTACILAALSSAGFGLTASAQQGPQRWDQLPLMEQQAFYRGPLQDTVIQRWRDPLGGAVCYIYMPIIAANTPTPGAPYVSYGANQIGSISCVPAP